MNIIVPPMVDNLTRTLARASAEQLRVMSCGGNSFQERFLQAPDVDITIDMQKLARVLEYEPANLTVSVEAGMTLAGLQAVLHEHGQFLPLDPPQPERATIGGIIAANAHGPLRLRHGTVRDWLIGVRVALADGTLIRGGGKVVKNVAGYDLAKLFVGSCGTLGVIVEATFKLAPLPAFTRTLRVQFPTHTAALAAMLPMWHWPAPPAAMELLDPLAVQQESDSYTLMLQLAGSPAALDRLSRDAEAVCREHDVLQVLRLEGSAEDAAWRRVRDLPATLSEGDITLLELRLPPSRLDEAISSTLAFAQQRHIDCTLFVRALQALWIALRADDANVIAFITQLRAWATERKGHLVVQRSPAILKEHVDVWGPGRADRILMLNLKAQFDPQNILNPGVFDTEP